MVEQSQRTKQKLEENTLLLVSDLQKIFGKLDKETLENITYMLYCSLAWMADDVLEQALEATRNNNAEPANKS